MSHPLVLEFVVDDKGNDLLKGIKANIKGIGVSTKKTGGFLKKVFMSGVMLQGMYKFKQAFSAATREVMEFNKVFKQVEGITGTSGKALDSLKKSVIGVSNVTEHTAVALGKVGLQVSKMGFTLEESLMVIPHMADLSTAAIADLSSVTGIAVQTMKSFQMEASDMEHIVNVIQGTVSQTALDFEDFAEAMKFVAPIAKTMTISLEETAAMIGILGDVGIKGSLGGTTLKNMFLNIMRPSENVRKVLEKMNWQGKNFTEVLKEMAAAGISVKDFLETFNRRAVAGSLALSQLHEKVDMLRESLEKDGIVVAEVAAKIREAWIPQLQILKNTFVNTFVVMGEILTDSDLGLGIEEITKKIIDLQIWLEKHPETIIKFAKDITIAANTVGKFLVLGFDVFIKQLDGIIRLFKIIIGLKIAASFYAMGKAAKIAATGFWTAATAAKGFTAAIPIIGQVAVGLWALNEALDYMVKRADDARREMMKLTYATDISALETKLKAAESYKILLDQINIKQRKLQQLEAGTNDQYYRREKQIEILKKQIEDFDKTMEKDVKTLSKRFGLEKVFFTAMSDDIDFFIDDLKIQLKEVEVISEKAAEELAKLFKIPGEDVKGDGKGKAAKAGERDMMAYIIAAAKVMEEMSGLLVLGVSGKKLQEAYKAQLEGLAVVAKEIPPIPIRVKLIYESLKSAAGGEGILGKPGTARVQFGEFGEFAPGEESPLLAAKFAAFKKTEEEISEMKKKFLDKGMQWEKEFSTWLKDYKQSDAEAEAERLEREAAERKAYIEEQFNTFAEAALMTTEMLSMIDDNYFNKKKSQLDKEMKLVDEKYDREIKRSEGNYYRQKIIDARYQRDKKKLIEEQEKLLRKQKEREKIWSLIDIAINTAVGITTAIASTPPPAGFVLATIVAALGITQAAIVASQEPYFGGGYTGYGNPKDIAGYVHRKEYVIPHRKVEDIGGAGEVERMIEERLEGMGGGEGKNIYIVIDTFIGNEEYERELFVKLQKESQRW